MQGDDATTRALPNQPSAGPSAPGERAGDLVGPYKLKEIIGEGGFGTVWLAEQKEPIARRVALKIIKPGMDSKEVIARFEQERQALALMDHPNIARVHDAGTTPAGRPYFAMEYVKGAPITDYCDRQRLTIAQRLELFASVCDAVQHAHMKGIIHRDLKPSNILVAAPDAASARQGADHAALPSVKIIDFGVAKALASKLTEKTIFTERGQLIGTPEYMSPEQAEMAETDIDTRSDVYALGVILYELLAGALPFDPKTLRSGGHAAIQRMIREVDPPRPSTKLTSLGAEGSQRIAEARRVGIGELTHSLKGELEWIPLKAMRKDRAERYRTASEFGDDIANYLHHKPLIAGPESAAYKVKKFIRRNRAGVAAGVMVFAALILGLAGTVWQYRAAAHERDIALDARNAEAEQRKAAEGQRALADAQRDRALKAESEARARADELTMVADFQAGMLAQINPARAGRGLTEDVKAMFAAALEQARLPAGDRAAQAEAFNDQWKRVNATDAARALIDRTILRPAITAIDTQFKDQPVVDAQLRQSLTYLYDRLGLYSAALPLQESALSTRRRVLGNEHDDTLSSINEMGNLLRALGRPAEAEPYYREALETRRRVLGPEHAGTLVSIGNMGQVLQAQKKLSEAEPYYREALETCRRVLGEDHPSTLICLNDLGGLLQDQSKLAEAEPYYREALERHRRVMGEEHPHTLTSIHNMGTLLDEQGRPAEAEPYYREALERKRRVLGEEHPLTLQTLESLARMLVASGRFAEAAPLVEACVEGRTRGFGAAHEETRVALKQAVRLYESWDRAEPGKGYDAKAAAWQGKLDAVTPPPEDNR